MVCAVRGAIKVGSNTQAKIWDASVKLVRELMARNAICEHDVISIIFSVTDDLTAANPATGLRKFGFSGVPLFCVQEAKVSGQAPNIIRVLLTCTARDLEGGGDASNPPGSKRLLPVYLDGAENLRPDLSDSECRD